VWYNKVRNFRTMKLSRIFSFLLIVAALVTAGFGCKGLSTAQQQAIAPLTLEYWTVFDDVDALQKEINTFRANHPYITVNVRQLRAEELYPRLVEALSEDHGPDIISVQNRRLGEFISKLAPMPSTVLDTTEVIEKGQFSSNVIVNSQTVPTVSLAQLDSEYIKTVGSDVVRGGQIFGLPLSIDMMAVFYNKDLLDRSGVAQPPTDWTSFQEAVKKITKYDKRTGKLMQYGTAFGTGTNISGSDDLLYVLFKQSGLDFVDRNGQAVFNRLGQRTVDVLNFYTDFANPSRDTYSWSEDAGDAFENFVAGRVGFFFGYSYHLPLINARAPQMEVRILPLFQLNSDSPVNVANYWIQSVTAKSKHQNEAWLLVNFLTHSKATKDYLNQTNRPTALRAYIADQKNKPELAPFIDQILIAQNWYKGRDYMAALKAVQDMISQWLSPIPENSRQQEWQANILNQTAAKINQTF